MRTVTLSSFLDFVNHNIIVFSRCVNRNAKMVYSECPMVPVGVVRNSAVPAGRYSHLQRPKRRATSFGRSCSRRGHVRLRTGHSGRLDLPEAKVSENQQTIATGITKVYTCLTNAGPLKSIRSILCTFCTMITLLSF